MAKAKSADDEGLLEGGDTGSENVGPVGDDLLAGTTASKPKKASGKKATSTAAKKKTVAAKPAAAPAKKAAAKAVKPKATGERAVRGVGKFAISPDEKAAIAKRIAASKKAATTKEIAERITEPTWKVRLACVSLVNDGKGSLKKTGNVLTYTPA